MFKRKTWSILFAVAVVIATLSLAQPCLSKQVGSVKALVGETHVNGEGQAEFKSLKAGDPISLNEYIQTDQNSKVLINLDDDSHNSLGELSEINLYDFERQNVAQYYAANVTSGLIRFVKKLSVTNPLSSYSVTTPTAIINVEPGDKADFVVQVFSQKRTTVTVIWGKVRVKNVLEDLATEKIVDSCRKVDVEENKVPSRVMGVSSQTLKGLITRTTVPRTLSEDIPNCGESFAIKKKCPDRLIWDGEQCVPPDCGDCRVLWGSRCVTCSELGMVCLRGICVQKICPPCSFWNGRRCAPCEEFGRVCVGGRCVPLRDCPPCSVWTGRRCIPCDALGLNCERGRCVHPIALPGSAVQQHHPGQQIPPKPPVDKIPSKPPVDQIPPKPPVDQIPSKPPVDQIPSKPPVDQIPSKPPVDKIPSKPAVDQIPSKPPVDKIPSKPPVDQIPSKPPVDQIPPKPPVDKIPSKPPVDKIPSKPPVDKIPSKPPVDQIPSKPPVDQIPRERQPQERQVQPQQQQRQPQERQVQPQQQQRQPQERQGQPQQQH
jgi:hypothetical protein